MNQRSEVEETVYNNGERLIPYKSHDMAELIRHRSSYLFFRKVIQADLSSTGKKRVTIIDLGCGVGHGCDILSAVKNSTVMGVDSSMESIEYARKYYCKTNISYRQEDLVEFIPNMPKYDYVISRNVFEHINNGLDLAWLTNWGVRLMFDVPYAEPAGRNPHHVLHDIVEDTFANWQNAELFFEDENGFIFKNNDKPINPINILCVISDREAKAVSQSMRFPVLAYHAIKYYRKKIVGIVQATFRMR
jgi:SAM-dependent methyltransferase